jgi:hypothetical protein
MKLLQYIVSGLIVSGCAVSSQQSQVLSPSELNTNTKRYSGQMVVVKGYVQLAPEGHILYESKELDASFRKEWVSNNGNFDIEKYDKYCLTVANPELLYRNRSTINGKTLIVQGRFIDNYLDGHTIDLGACPLPTAIVIDEHDLTRRYGSILPLR